MGIKDLRKDSGAFMLNISPIFMLGYALIALSVLAFTFHGLGWTDEGFLASLWTYAPFVCGFGVMVIASKIQDPRIVVGLGALGVVIYYVIFKVIMA